MRHLFFAITLCLFATPVLSETLNQVIIHSPAGEPVGFARDTVLTAGPDLTFTCDVNYYNGVQFEVRSTDQAYFWYVFMSNVNGTPLTPGEYNDCVRFPTGSDQTHNKLLIFSSYSGCNSLTGRFIIKELTWASPTQIATLWAVAEQSCESRYPTLSVEIFYNINRATPTHTTSWGSLKTIYR